MRDILFTLLMLALVPVCFRRPLVGLLNFSWLAYMRTQDLTWGFARYQRWSFLVAGVTLAGFLASGQVRFFLPRLRCWIMLGLLLWVGLSILNSGQRTGRQISELIDFAKIVGVALFTTTVVLRKEHLRVLLWVIALSFGFYGVKIGIAGVLSLGRLKVLQGPGGMLDDNNNFALALCMGLPMLVQFLRAERSAVLRRGLMAIIPLTIFVIFLTHSRGGFLSLVALGGVMIWRSERRLQGLVVAALIGVLVLLVMPGAYLERLSTIASYEQDSSARGRLEAWKVAISMALDNPVFGVGLNMFQDRYGEYILGLAPRQNIVAHNAYLEILAECGFPALFLYLSLIGATYWSIWGVRREARRRYRTSWILDYCTMFEASLTAFVVGSTFLNRAKFDLFYHFVAIVVVFEFLALREMTDEQATPLRAPEARSAIEPRERRGFERKPRERGFARHSLPQAGT
jgi:probable O-glycosylation ligase (exosortase A-associated)